MQPITTRRLGEELPSTARATGPDHDAAEHLAVIAALAELRPDKRVVVKLHLLADLTIAETAGRLAFLEGTVKSRLHRALAELRRLLDVSRDCGPRGPPSPVRCGRGRTEGA